MQSVKKPEPASPSTTWSSVFRDELTNEDRRILLSAGEAFARQSLASHGIDPAQTADDYAHDAVTSLLGSDTKCSPPDLKTALSILFTAIRNKVIDAYRTQVTPLPGGGPTEEELVKSRRYVTLPNPSFEGENDQAFADEQEIVRKCTADLDEEAKELLFRTLELVMRLNLVSPEVLSRIRVIELLGRIETKQEREQANKSDKSGAENALFWVRYPKRDRLGKIIKPAAKPVELNVAAIARATGLSSAQVRTVERAFLKIREGLGADSLRSLRTLIERLN